MLHGSEVITKATPQISLMDRVRLWAKIPGTTQHDTLTRKSLEGAVAQTVICYMKGRAFDAALFVNEEFTCIKNKTEGLDVTVALSTLRDKLKETTTWAEARWIVLVINNMELRIKKTSLTAALQRYE